MPSRGVNQCLNSSCKKDSYLFLFIFKFANHRTKEPFENQANRPLERVLFVFTLQTT